MVICLKVIISSLKKNIKKSVRIGFIYLHQDDPAKSTMKKLQKFNLAEQINRDKMGGYVVLRYDAEKTLLPVDRSQVSRKGICIIEGSWNLGDLLGSYRKGTERKLPVLMAGNPVNFGKFNKLSSVEAVAAALFITGYADQAKEVMGKFTWGHTFMELNIELLKSYAGCQSADDLEKVYLDFDIDSST